MLDSILRHTKPFGDCFFTNTLAIELNYMTDFSHTNRFISHNFLADVLLKERKHRKKKLKNAVSNN